MIPPALATIYMVNPEGTGDFPTIQAAIDGAVDGDVVELANGTFVGDGNRDIEFRGHAIILRSQLGDRDSCIIDCQASETDQHRGLVFSSDEDSMTVLSGITITNGYVVGDWPNGLGGGILCGGASPKIANCAIRSCYGSGMAAEECTSQILSCSFTDNYTWESGGGLYCRSSCSVTLHGCTFESNNAYVEGGGIYCTDMCDPYVEQCLFINNGPASVNLEYSTGTFANCTFEDATHGFRLFYSSPTIDHTLIAFNSGSAVYCQNGYCYPALMCCDLYGNGSDWSGYISSQYGQAGNISQDPIFCGALHNPDLPRAIHSSSPCAPEQNPECGLIGAGPIGCTEIAMYVRPDGQGAYPNIQSAVDATLGGDEVVLADGVFTGAGNRNVYVEGLSIVIRSESEAPEQCIIDCEGGVGNEYRGFTFVDIDSAATSLEGICIQNGFCSSGGAVVFSMASPVITNCMFRDNVADIGGALRCDNASAPIIDRCVFTNNWAWGDGGAADRNIHPHFDAHTNQAGAQKRPSLAFDTTKLTVPCPPRLVFALSQERLGSCWT